MPPKPKDPKPKEEKPDVQDDSYLEADKLRVEVAALRGKLQRSDQKCYEYATENKESQIQLEKQKTDQAEIFEYLNKELMSKADEITSLEQKCQDLTLERTLDREQYEERIKAERQAAQEMTSKLQAEIQHYATSLSELKDFIKKKDVLKAELEEAKAKLIKEQKEHNIIVNDLERQALQAKDRLKKEMIQRIQQTKAAFMKMTGSQLEVTTKRTIMENESMSSELAFQSRESEKLIQKNDKLVAENTVMRRELELYKQMEKELTKRNNAYLKTIKTLLSKLKAMDEGKKQLIASSKHKEADLMSKYQEEFDNVQQSLYDCAEELQQVRAAYEHASTELQRMVDLQDEVVQFLLHCMQDVKVQLGKPRTETDRIIEELVPDISPSVYSNPGGSESLTEVLPTHLGELNTLQRDRVLRFLFSKLHTFAVQQSRSFQDPNTVISDPLHLPPIKNDRQQPSMLNGVDISKPLREINAFLDEHPPGASTAVSLETAQDNHAVSGEVRPWGKKASNSALAKHTPDTYLKKSAR